MKIMDQIILYSYSMITREFVNDRLNSFNICTWTWIYVKYVGKVYIQL